MDAKLARPAAAAALRSRCVRASARSVRVADSRRARLVVRAAADGGFDLEAAKKKYQEITYSIPPLLTAGTVPVIGLSLLSKALTGHGLPGTLLGGIEGLSWLILPLGAGSFLPRVSEIVSGGDFSQQRLLAILGRDTRGESASERVGKISEAVDPNSPLGMQLMDLEKAKRERETETPEQRAARERKRAELARMALGVGKKISADDVSKAAAEGSREQLLSQPVTQTLAQGMTVENYDMDVTRMSDEQLAKVNLSTPKVAAAVAEPEAAAATSTIVDVAIGNPDFSILVEAVVKAGLAPVLSGPGPFTVFAPTNAAFAQALEDLSLTKEQLLALPTLGEVLRFHVLPTAVPASALSDGLEATTVQGAKVRFDLSSGVKVNGATDVAADVAASNGVIHVIDRVILPPAPENN